MAEFNVVGKTENKEESTTIKFTRSQEAAVNGIMDFIAQPFDVNKYIIGLVGAGGTGKTFSINYIIDYCRLTPSTIKCTSTTHKACRVFSDAICKRKVDTIQSTFGLRLDLKLEDFNPDNPQFNPNSKPKLDNIQLLIIDEASMLPAKLTTYICKVCKELQIKILMIGDDNQLPPVNETRSIAFDRCFKLYKLTEIVRQGELNPILTLLTKLRHDIKYKSFTFIEYVTTHLGEMTYNDNQEGYSILGPQGFKNFIDICFKDEAYQKNIDMYRIIAYTNLKVSSWNNYIRNSIIDDANKGIITNDDLILSYETIVNEFNEAVIANSEEYIIKSIIDFTEDRHHLDGYLIQFQQIHGGKVTKPIFVVDHTKIDNISRYIKILDELKNRALCATGATRVQRWKDYYNFKKNHLIITNIIDKYTRRIKYTRDLDYGFALTSHKSQGSTYDTVFVDLNDMIYDKNGFIYKDTNELLRRLYVACSRARTNLILCYGNIG